MITNRDIADILRAVADGRAANGDGDGARRLRKGARVLERRDGPGEPYRKHVRTGLRRRIGRFRYWTDWWRQQ